MLWGLIIIVFIYLGCIRDETEQEEKRDKKEFKKITGRDYDE